MPWISIEDTAIRKRRDTMQNENVDTFRLKYTMYFHLICKVTLLQRLRVLI